MNEEQLKLFKQLSILAEDHDLVLFAVSKEQWTDAMVDELRAASVKIMLKNGLLDDKIS